MLMPNFRQTKIIYFLLFSLFLIFITTTKPIYAQEDSVIVRSIREVGPFGAEASPYIGGVRFIFGNYLVLDQSVPVPFTYDLGIPLFFNHRTSEYVDAGLFYGHNRMFPPGSMYEVFEHRVDYWLEPGEPPTPMVGYYFAGVRNACFDERWYGNLTCKQGISELPHEYDMPVVIEWAFPYPSCLPRSTEYLWSNLYQSDWFWLYITKPSWVDSLGSFPEMNAPLEFLTQNDWEDWLPTADLGQDKPIYQTLPLRFRFRCPEGTGWSWDMRVRLYEISAYPGYAINYRGATDSDNLDNGTIWEDASKPCSADSVADIRIVIEDQITPNLWDISFNTEDDENGEPIGYYEASYTNILHHNDTFTIVVTPDDFSAKSNFSVEITPHGRESWFPILKRYLKDEDGDDIIVPFITVPRDEEVSYQDGKNGQPELSSVGDRLADAWEEHFLENTTSTSDSFCYTKIYQCKPFNDDSGEDRTFYPQYTSTEIRKAGDGLLNFEKYRGVFGVIDGNGDFVHCRLPTALRNVFVIPYVAEEENPIPPEYLRDDMITDFNMLESSSSVIVHELKSNDLIDSILVSEQTIYTKPSSWMIRSLRSEYNSQKQLNYLINGYDDYNQVYSTYCVQFNEIPESIRRAFEPHWPNMEVSGGFTCDANGDGTLSPQAVDVCYTFFENIYDSTMVASLIKARQRVAFAHELGHFVGMHHTPYLTLNRSIMNEELPWNYTTLSEVYLMRDYRSFRLLPIYCAEDDR